MIDALIIIDNSYREHLNLNLLKKIFEKKGLISRIISKHLFEDAINKYRPQIVITPRITQNFKKIFDLSEKFDFNIFLLPCEHGGGDKDRIISFLVGHENKDGYDLKDFKNYRKIKKIFAPSDIYKKICLETKLFDENQVIVTGTLSSDFWFEDISNLIDSKKNKASVGIATSFKSTFFGINFNSFLEGLSFIKDITNKDDFENAINKNIYFHSFETLSFIHLLKIIEENPDINFSWRLHPQENIRGALIIAKKIKNLEVNRDIFPYNWIKDQSLIMLYTSTMIYDSYFLKTPTISLINLIPQDIKMKLENTKKPLKTNQSDNVKSLDDIIKIIKNRDFDQSKNINEDELINESIKNYNFPRKKFAVVAITDEIIQHVKTDKNNFFLKLLMDIIINIKTIRAAYSIKHKDNHLDKVLNPLRLRDKFKINQFINKILNKIV